MHRLLPVAPRYPTVGQIAAGFESLFGAFEHEGGEAPNCVFGLSPDLEIAYLNEGWFRFARENAGEPAISEHWPLGRPVLDAVPAVLQSFYRDLYASVLSGPRRPRRPVVHQYECPSPTEYRRFAMHLYPLGQQEGVLVVNSLEAARPIVSAAAPAGDETAYRDPHGLLTQCAHCRRFRNYHADQRWDWIPQWVERMPEHTSHGLCETCFAYYYPAK